jgi:four helix bundle protein
MVWRDLEVWKKAHSLTLDVYRITTGFPKSEMYGLTSQLRRASSSVPANIVEGQSRNTTREYIQFLYNSRGSLEETRYFLLLAKDLKYINSEEFEMMEGQGIKVSTMLNNLIKSLKKLQET